MQQVVEIFKDTCRFYTKWANVEKSASDWNQCLDEAEGLFRYYNQDPLTQELLVACMKRLNEEAKQHEDDRTRIH